MTINSSEASSIIKPGHAWNLGRHLLIYGDSTLLTDLGRFDLVFTDPPFDLSHKIVEGVISPLSDQFIIAGNGREYIRLCNRFRFWFEHVGIRSQPRSLPGWKGPHILHWNSAFLTQGDSSHCFDRNLAGGYFPSVSQYKDAPQGNYAKPLQWAIDLLSRCHAQTIVDPFSGSGTTLIACEKLGKRFTGIELSLDRCHLTIQRWERSSRLSVIGSTHL